MPEYRFFASYARANTKQDPLLLRFCEDLINYIRENLHIGEAYFFDVQNIPVGSQYPRSLADALRGARSMLAFYSPGYFNSPDCGREIKAFQMRAAAFQEANPGSDCGPLGVQWTRSASLQGRIPDSLRSVEYGVPAHKDALQTKKLRDMVSANGLKHIMQCAEAGSATDKLAYIDIVECYAEHIMRVTAQYDLTPYTFQEDYRDLPYDFPPKEVVGAPAAVGPGVGPTTTVRERKGPSIVKVLFLVGTANSFHDVVERTSLHCYDQEEDFFWKPYLPDDDHIFSLVSRAVTAEKGAIETLSWTAPPTKEALRDVLQRIKANNNILLVVVDPWSSFIPQFVPAFEVVDQDRLPYGAVFLPWNRQDLDTKNKLQELKNKLAEVFGSIAVDTGQLEEMMYDSPAALEAQLRRKIGEIRSRITERAARTGQIRPLPQGSALPTVTVASR